jgi:type II secretory pathway component GspD/PulD (secretin)
VGQKMKEKPRIMRAGTGRVKCRRLLALAALLAGVVFINPPGVYCAQENSSAQETANDKISLDLKNVDIVELLRIISLKTGKTIVPGKDVTGRITVYLSNVAFNDVLDIILLTQGLALDKKGNVYYVMSGAEYRKIYGRDYIDQRKIQTVKLVYAKTSVIFTALSQLKSEVGKIVADESSGTIILIDIPERLELLNKTIKDLDQPLTTTVYDLNYMKAADAKAQFGAAITPGTGEVIIDERSGKAIISDLPQKMRKMNMLVRELDEQSRQVYVEADIVELTLSDQFDRGIDWQTVYDKLASSGLAFAGYFPTTLTAAYQTISLGTLATDKYSVIINFLSTYGKSNIISQPRIAILNNEEGSLMVGTREAYVTQTQSQATSTTVTSESVEFIDVGVKLKIVPRIGADGFITMKIKPEVSTVLSTLTTSLGSVIPIVQTSQSETVVKVKDGTMIMIAGMTKIEDTDTIKGWPVLSRIPFLGAFFSNRAKTKKRTEVIIFLTPRLSSGDESLRGTEITKIISMEDLPANLQAKVTRDKKIDETLINEIQKPEKTSHQEKTLEEQEARQEVMQKAKPDNQAPVEKIPSEPPEETAKDYYRKGLQAQIDSDPNEARRNFTKAVELDNKYAPAYNSLGIIYEQESKFEKAQAMYLKAIAVDQNFSPAYSNLALFNEDQGDFIQALEYWRKRALRGDPDDPWTAQAIRRVQELEGN